MPGIATVLVGADPASQLYVGMKHRESEAIGMNSIQRELPADATQDEVEALIDELNADPACHGYIVQLPLPKHIDTDAILERIDPAKDADGLHPTNLGRLVLNVNAPITSPLPCTPRGRDRAARSRNGYDLKGKHVVVVGRGVTIGRSIGLLLTRRELQRDGHADPHRHGRPRPRTCGRPTSSSRRPGVKHLVRGRRTSSPAPPCSTSASRARRTPRPARRRSTATCTPMSPRSRAASRRTPVASAR